MNILKRKRFFLVLFFVFLILNSNSVYSADEWKGLVPCGGKEDPCTICHLFIGIKALIDWIRDMTVIVGLFILTVAGVMWVIGVDGMVNMAKSAIQNAIIGIIIVFAAWLIIFFGLKLIAAKQEKGSDNPNQLVVSGWNVSCSTKANIGGYGTKKTEPSCMGTGIWCDPGTMSNKVETNNETSWDCTYNNKTITCVVKNGGGGKTGGNFAEILAENNRIYTELKDNNISVISTSGSANMCKGNSQTKVTGCITLYGLKNEATSGVKNFKNSCPSCDVRVVSATDKIVDYETGKTYCNEVHGGCDSPNSTTKHDYGKKIDIEDTPSVNSYIMFNYKKIGTRSDGATVYSDGMGNYYADENDHWDVCYNCPNPVN